ncbi:hypothetical protein FHS61_002558 [Altererythrobacter atlanticus]|uniref:hypothetical protein n=1 Tax=Croceibacterium atlanticum TaxID=1267766 RepID=UPI000AC065E7|nr:hypothetical protein [Croceibacterium atlanticum]MBB5733523.1 hypothetical protein [Croceibacterium atlanticum]
MKNQTRKFVRQSFGRFCLAPNMGTLPEGCNAGTGEAVDAAQTHRHGTLIWQF